jgi:hypothetical protein
LLGKMPYQSCNKSWGQTIYQWQKVSILTLLERLLVETVLEMLFMEVKILKIRKKKLDFSFIELVKLLPC